MIACLFLFDFAPVLFGSIWLFFQFDILFRLVFVFFFVIPGASSCKCLAARISSNERDKSSTAFQCEQQFCLVQQRRKKEIWSKLPFSCCRTIKGLELPVILKELCAIVFECISL